MKDGTFSYSFSDSYSYFFHMSLEFVDTVFPYIKSKWQLIKKK